MEEGGEERRRRQAGSEPAHHEAPAGACAHSVDDDDDRFEFPPPNRALHPHRLSNDIFSDSPSNILPRSAFDPADDPIRVRYGRLLVDFASLGAAWAVASFIPLLGVEMEVDRGMDVTVRILSGLVCDVA